MAILSHFFVALKDIADYQTKDFGFGIWLINALDKYVVFKAGKCTINKFRGLVLHNNIRNALIDKVPTKITKTPSGLKQEYDIKLVAKDGSIKTAKVVVIVQKDNGTSVYRIITLYPGKKVK